jgi:hypothetical protein
VTDTVDAALGRVVASTLGLLASGLILILLGRDSSRTVLVGTIVVAARSGRQYDREIEQAGDLGGAEVVVTDQGHRVCAASEHWADAHSLVVVH